MSYLVDKRLPGIIDKMEQDFLESRPWDAELIREVMNGFRIAIVKIQNEEEQEQWINFMKK